MVRRPPSSALFPYPTLFRSAIDIRREYGVSQLPVVRAEPPVTAGEVVGSVEEKTLLDALFAGRASLADRVERHMRSEEHTSELQSRQYLVCRLLLEKKKKTQYNKHTLL